MYRHREDTRTLEHSERRHRDGAASGMSLSVRARVAPARQNGEAASLSEMQESEVGRAEGRPQICVFKASRTEIGPWESDECVIHSL